MCMGCWDKYGRPIIVNDKTEAALALVRQVYDVPYGGAGGHLHIVLDDWNLEDSSIEYCQRGHSDPEWLGTPMSWKLTDVEAKCAEAFLAMTMDERASCLAQYDGIQNQPEPDTEPTPEVRIYVAGVVLDYEVDGPRFNDGTPWLAISRHDPAGT